MLEMTVCLVVVTQTPRCSASLGDGTLVSRWGALVSNRPYLRGAKDIGLGREGLRSALDEMASGETW